MAIQLRRGAYTDYDPTKLLPGEVGVVQNGDPSTSDGEAIYIATKAGSVKQLATKDQMQSAIETILATELPIATAAATAEAEAAADRAEAAAETLEIDDTLTQQGQAADAKATGDAVSELSSAIEEIEPGMSEEAKTALLACFDNVLWEDGDGQDYISALRQALYPNEYPQIQASLSLGTHIVFYDDEVNTLKPYLTVTYYASESSSGVNVPGTDYALSGSLDSAINTVTVTYNGLHTTVSVNALMPVFEYDSSSGKLLSEMEGLEVFDSTVVASETLSDGHLLLSASSVSNPSVPTYKQYRIIPNTFSNGMMRVKFNLLAIPNSDDVYNGMRLRISNGSNGVSIGQGSKSNGISINYAEGSTVKSAGIIQLNEWHVLELYISGSSQTISLDGTPLVSLKPLSSVAATNNSLFIQNASSSRTVSFYVDKLQLFEIV